MREFGVADMDPERVGGQVETDPDEHSGQRPDEAVHGDFVDDDAPVGGDSIRGASARRDEVGAFFQDAAHGLHAALVGAAETFEPADPAGDVPGVAIVGVLRLRADDELGDEGLDEAGWLLGGRLGDAEDAFDQGGLGGDPAETAARGDGFGKGVEADDAALGVDGEVGGHERVEEGEAGGSGPVVVFKARLGVGRGGDAAGGERGGVCRRVL